MAQLLFLKKTNIEVSLKVVTKDNLSPRLEEDDNTIKNEICFPFKKYSYPAKCFCVSMNPETVFF